MLFIIKLIPVFHSLENIKYKITRKPYHTCERIIWAMARSLKMELWEGEFFKVEITSSNLPNFPSWAALTNAVDSFKWGNCSCILSHSDKQTSDWKN